MYEPFYSDNSWNIINRNTWRIIKWSISWCSYYYIRDKKTIWKVYNHDIVAHCFLWEKPKWFVVDHIDCLDWGSQACVVLLDIFDVM